MHRREVLQGLIERHGWRHGAELGVLKGDTYLWLLEHCPNLHLIGVDTFRLMEGQVHRPDRPEAEDNYRNCDFSSFERHVSESMRVYGDRAVLYKMTTNEAARLVARHSLDFVFIDADHRSHAVLMDIVHWAPLLKPTGWLVGHDTHFPTVKKVIDWLLPGWEEHAKHIWTIPLERTDLADYQ